MADNTFACTVLTPERPWRWGFEYMGRRNVNSDEWQTIIGEPQGPNQQTLRGEQDELNLTENTQPAIMATNAPKLSPGWDILSGL